MTEETQLTSQQQQSAVERIEAQRASLTPEQARLINHVWDARLRRKRAEWPPAISINLALDFPDNESALRLAPPGTLFLFHAQPVQYGLSLLGVILSTPGESYLGLLARYLEHVCTRAKDNPQLPDNKRVEVASSLGLSPEQSLALGDLIGLASLYGSHMSNGEEWSCGYPEDVARLRFVPDLTEHVAGLALETARRIIAQTTHLQVVAPEASTTRKPRRTFRFVRNSDLRSAARVDWREARLAHRSSSWRSCVIACGAVLEAMLLDAAETDVDAARAAFSNRFSGRTPAPLRRWNLNELVEVCAQLKVLGEQSFHLTHALRFSRDLVHPGRAVRLRASIRRPEADVALATVRHVHGALMKRCREAWALARVKSSPTPAG